MTYYDHIEVFTGRYLDGGCWFGQGRTWNDWKAVDSAAVQVAGLDISRFEGGLTGMQKWVFELLRPCGKIVSLARPSLIPALIPSQVTWHVIDARGRKPMMRVGFGSSLDADRAIAMVCCLYSELVHRLTGSPILPTAQEGVRSPLPEQCMAGRVPG
jgi:hypothetical protein